MTKTRILVVDDEARGVDLLVRTLHKMGEVVTATSADEGWKLFQGSEFDLVISDQRMPGMSGIELLSRVASRTPTTGRILLTGYTDLEATLDAINRGQVHAYLTKPSAPPEVQGAVAEVLERTERSSSTGRSVLAEFSKRLPTLIEIAKQVRGNEEATDAIIALADQLVSEAESLLDECLDEDPKEPRPTESP